MGDRLPRWITRDSEVFLYACHVAGALHSIGKAFVGFPPGAGLAGAPSLSVGKGWLDYGNRRPEKSADFAG